ncbi:MAG: DUF3551 domain-containing protein [Pseudomonadota bacterium]
MLKLCLTASAVAGLALLASACATQRVMDQPWCGTVSDIGRAECSYSTLEQCQAMVSGVGGVCTLNPRGPDGGRKRAQGLQRR